MDIYFALIGMVLILPVACCGIRNLEKRKNAILIISILCLFLLTALKAPSVGKDIAGYKRVYDSMKYQTWDNYDTTWMEWGYEFLMMAFTHIFKASFQTFMVCVYGFVYYSYYRFIKRYSQDYTTSVILYICFTFLTFDMSAVRTVIGVAICLYAIPYAEKPGIKNFLKFFLIVIIAAQIHKSAYIFVAAYFIIKIHFSVKSSVFYIGGSMALLLLKSQFYGFINTYLKSVQESRTSLGGNLLIYIMSVVLTIYVWIYYKKTHKSYSEMTEDDSRSSAMATDFSDSGLAMRMIYVGIVLQLFGAGTVLTRMAQYFQVFILILIPNNIMRLDQKSRMMVRMILYSLAIVYFIKFTLIPDPLDIVSYKLFWKV